ncbi:Cys-rich peptide radical SAM maturase CcpM [Neglecta sp. X4]|uniref:Cys-rich peptide radical SAM maturase CcpM n=1 Tax=unclassified Neglectibacter TaxID=2632164 RepID=UPI001370D0A7|nr:MULTISPECIES: Cys-rich peptide radical SAM maturase CcpM [unclassified Neglectibacter]NBI18892.1 Cys-rich peptide radical SAM maturase CcpM [Neglectibacter sp. 59]NBJ74511.1 Cys-rich peptide radical SAM maturase CcpM [Neglectibacter sp. X4]NCE82344.1 Cys-rich peptide radical SAM maturase CcpM [Neglectibacter sp. X58]
MTYKIIESPFGKYVYSRNANRLIKMPENNDSQSVEGYLSEQGFSTRNNLRKIRHPSSWMIEEILRGHVFNLILQVTQNCNLRCSYCAYSGNYYNRTHTTQKMSYDVAKRAVDFLFEHSSECEEIVIGFYGGEPLLEFDLVKRVVDYADHIGWGKNIQYVVTTNATLLKGEILDFLVAHNFSVMVSFDGPKEVHDKNRKFIDGKGSFDLIINNLELVKERYPDFYKNIMTNTVLSPTEDYECIKKFFEADTVIHALNSRLSLISAEDAKEPITYGEHLSISESIEIVKILLYMLGKIHKESISKIYLSQINMITESFRNMDFDGLEGKVMAHPGGPCVPGKKRLFVDVNGDFHPCEKISECAVGRIGSLSSGFDINAVLKILNIAEITEDACKNCWAFLWCNQCANASLQRNKLSSEIRLSKCSSSKSHAINTFKTMIFLKEYGFDIERWKSDNAIDDFLRK